MPRQGRTCMEVLKCFKEGLCALWDRWNALKKVYMPGGLINSLTRTCMPHGVLNCLKMTHVPHWVLSTCRVSQNPSQCKQTPDHGLMGTFLSRSQTRRQNYRWRHHYPGVTKLAQTQETMPAYAPSEDRLPDISRTNKSWSFTKDGPKGTSPVLRPDETTKDASQAVRLLPQPEKTVQTPNTVPSLCLKSRQRYWHHHDGYSPSWLPWQSIGPPGRSISFDSMNWIVCATILLVGDNH